MNTSFFVARLLAIANANLKFYSSRSKGSRISDLDR